MVLCFPVHANIEQLDTVQVSGNATDAVSPYNFIGSHDSIELDNYQNQFLDLSSILKKQTGIDLQSVSGVGQYSTPIIRGSESQQVLVFSNGLPLNSLTGGSANIGSITLDNAESIHIYRGFVPMELSPTAIGGAINIISNTSSNQEGSFKYTSGIYGLSSTHIKQSVDIDDLTLNFDGLYQTSENDYIYKEQNPVNTPSNPKFEPRYNNATSTKNINLHLNSNIETTENFQARVSSQHYKRELSGLINTYLNSSFLETEDNSFSTSYKKGELINGIFEIGYQYKVVTEIYDDQKSQIGLGIQHNQYNSDFHSFNLKNSYQVGINNLILNQNIRYEEFGINYLNDSLSSRDDCYLRNQCDRIYERKQFNTGIRLESSINQSVSLNQQLVATHNEDDIPDSERKNTKTYWSLYSGLNYNVDDLSELYLAVSKQVRPPATSELFGDRGTTIGNPNLKPEEALSFEVGYTFQTATLNSKISIYLRDIHNQIFKEQDSRGIVHFDNYGKSQLSGIEFSFDINITQNIQYKNNLSHQLSEIIDDQTSVFIGNELSNHRTWFNSQSIGYTYGNINISLETDFQSGGFYNSKNTSKRPDVLKINSHASYTWQHSSLNLSFLNITNNQTRDYLLTPVMGTTAYLTYRKQWDL